MKKRDMDLIVGGSILIALLIMVGSILWLKDVKVSSRMVEYGVLFPNVGTLLIGDPVMVNGVKKGVVGRIGLHNDSVLVIIKLEKDIPLTDSSTITVQNIGLLGERMVGVQLSRKGIRCTPLSRKKEEPVHYLHGRFDTGIGEAMGMVGKVLGEVEVLIRDVAEIVNQTVGDSAFATVFHNVLRRLDTVTVLAEALVKDNRADVNAAVNNLRTISTEIRDIIETNRERIDSIIANGQTLSEEALAITDGVDSIVASLRTVLGYLERGEGVVGELLRDSSFAGDLRATMNQVDTLVRDVKSEGLKLRIRFGFRKRGKK